MTDCIKMPPIVARAKEKKKNHGEGQGGEATMADAIKEFEDSPEAAKWESFKGKETYPVHFYVYEPDSEDRSYTDDDAPRPIRGQNPKSSNQHVLVCRGAKITLYETLPGWDSKEHRGDKCFPMPSIITENINMGAAIENFKKAVPTPCRADFDRTQVKFRVYDRDGKDYDYKDDYKDKKVRGQIPRSSEKFLVCPGATVELYEVALVPSGPTPACPTPSGPGTDTPTPTPSGAGSSDSSPTAPSRSSAPAVAGAAAAGAGTAEALRRLLRRGTEPPPRPGTKPTAPDRNSVVRLRIEGQ